MRENYDGNVVFDGKTDYNQKATGPIFTRELHKDLDVHCLS